MESTVLPMIWMESAANDLKFDEWITILIKNEEMKMHLSDGDHSIIEKDDTMKGEYANYSPDWLTDWLTDWILRPMFLDGGQSIER